MKLRLLLPLAACALFGAAVANASAAPILRLGAVHDNGSTATAPLTIAITKNYCAQLISTGLYIDITSVRGAPLDAAQAESIRAYGFDFLAIDRSGRRKAAKNRCWSGGPISFSTSGLPRGRYAMETLVWAKRDGRWIKHAAYSTWWR